jgi:subtilisin family serine protease
VYEFSQGQYDKAVATLLAALAAAGLRQAVARAADPPPARPAALALGLLLLAGPAAVAGDTPHFNALPVGGPAVDPPPVWAIPPDERVVEAFDLAADVPPLAAEFWAAGTGVQELWARGITGKGVTVGVVDTGVQADHPLLAGRVGKARDFTGSGPADRNAHGTHCVGVVATVAPGATVNSYKALGDDGSGSDLAIARAVDAAVADGCQVVSLSLGSDRPGPYSGPAVDRALKAGVVVVAAAGNSGRAGVGYPGAHPGVLCVAAVDGRLKVADFSSRGRRLDVAGYGVHVRSTVPGSRTGTMSGTSMACPNVAGQAAVALSAKRVAPADLRRLCQETAEDLAPAGFDADTGHGFARVANLVGKLLPPADDAAEARYRDAVAAVRAGRPVVLAVGVPGPAEFVTIYEFPAGFKGIRAGVYDCFLSGGGPVMLRRPDPAPMPARLAPPVFAWPARPACPGGNCPWRR